MGEIRSKINYEEVKRKAQKDTIKDIMIIYIAVFIAMVLLCSFIVAYYSTIIIIPIMLIFCSIIFICSYYALYEWNIEQESIKTYVEQYLSTDELTEVMPKDEHLLKVLDYIKHYAKINNEGFVEIYIKGVYNGEMRFIKKLHKSDFLKQFSIITDEQEEKHEKTL